MAVSLEKVRFLVVDDNVHVLNIVKTMLRGFGAIHVFDARTPSEALEHLRNDAIDIVILDYMLGETDGVEFLRRLRSDPKSPSPFVPVIMLTAHTEKSSGGGGPRRRRQRLLHQAGDAQRRSCAR